MWSALRTPSGHDCKNENVQGKAIFSKGRAQKMFFFLSLCTSVSFVPCIADVGASQIAQSLSKVNDETIKDKNDNGHVNKHVHHASNEKTEMKNHQHQEGDWMFSYRFMVMSMKDNRNGTDRLGVSEVLANGSGDYRIAPIEMTMNMHMLGIMYAPSKNYTLMAMIPYIENSMDHVTAMGSKFSTKSSGLGDISLSINSANKRGFSWKLGMSFPTGSQDYKDTTPMGRSVLPYPMQIGSGTYDLIAGTGYLIEQGVGQVGVETRGIFRLGKNDDSYRVGNQYDLTIWYSRQINHQFSLSARGIYQYKDNYKGRDSRYAMARRASIVPTVVEDLRGGQRLNFALAINLSLSKRHRFSVEYQKPVWQNLDGPQLGMHEALALAWQLAL